MPTPEDPDLQARLAFRMQQLAARDPQCRQAMRELHDTLRPRLLRRLRHLLGDAHEAEDVLQEVLEAVYENAPQYRGDAKVTTWVNRIATHKVADVLRKRYADREWIDRTVELAEDERPDPRSAPPVLPVVPLAVIMECYKRQWEALKRERPAAAEAVYLKYLDDLSMEELAEHRKGTLAGTKEFLARMRRAVRAFLGRCRPDGGPGDELEAPA